MDAKTLSDFVFGACNDVEEANPATHGGKGWRFGIAVFDRLKPLVCDKPEATTKALAYTSQEFRDFETVLRDTVRNRRGKDRDNRKHAHEFDSIEGAEALLENTPWWRWPTVEILDASNDQVVKVVKALKVEAPKVRFLAYREGFRSNGSSGFITRPVSPGDPDFRSILASEASKAYDFGSREAAQAWCDERNHRYEIDAYSVVEAPKVEVPKVEAPKVRYVVRRFYSGRDFGYLVRPIPCGQSEIGALDLDISKAYDFGSREAAQAWCDERNHRYGIDSYHVVTTAEAPKVEAPKVRYVVKRDGVGTGLGFLGSLIPLEVSDPGTYLCPSSQKAYDFGTREAAQKWCDDRHDKYGVTCYNVVEVA